MSQSRLRNIGIVAHIDAGKTTVSERILFYTGVERRMGEVHEGTAVMDWMDEERRRGITITSAATTVPWREHDINLIDTPGHVDFTVEVERCMRVLDGAVLVVNAVAGVQSQSETVWRQIVRHHVSCIAFVNQMDRAGADYFSAVADLEARLGVKAIPTQYPIGSERDFRAVVDLVSGEALEFPEEGSGRDPRRIDVPIDVRDEVGVLRAELIETLAEDDEDVLTAFLDERDPEPALLRRALRARVLARNLMPVLCGAALRNVAIQPLLDAIIDYLPSPGDVPPVVGVDVDGEDVSVARDAAGGVVAFAFKLVADPNEDLVFARIYSGTLEPGRRLFNPRVGRMERIARVLRMHADARVSIERAGPGDIVALSGCKMTVTGDTLCEHDGAIVLEKLTFPAPVITRVVEPRAMGDREKLGQALERLAFEDPSFRVSEDPETGQWLVAGMGELHLEIKEHRLKDDFRLEVNVGQPRVAYREAPTRVGIGTGSVDRVLAGTRVFGAVDLEVHPTSEFVGTNGRSTRLPSVTWRPDCLVPQKMRAAVAESLVLEAHVGPRFGFPMGAIDIEVFGGGSHPERDAELGFTQAASAALRKALAEAAVVLLEPVMSFEIEAPAEFMSAIIGVLNAKHAAIRDLSVDGELRRVVGEVPMVQMFGHASTLRSLSQGRASFSLTPAGFRPVSEQELEARGLVWQ